MKQINPFPYSMDNKRYYTFNYYLKTTFGQKVFKVPLNANFSCPNRDGSKGVGGCTFCSALGSGDYAGDVHADLRDQFRQSEAMMRRKWPDGAAMAYFQAYTNTYADLQTLKEHFDPFIEMDEVVALAIATRADCLDDDVIAYLDTLAQKKEVWLELGLQSIYDQSALTMNRGHDFATFLDAIERLKGTHLKLCVHLMNSLPNESKEMMIESARVIGALPIHAIKIHMLHIIRSTRLALDYLREPFPLLSMEDYVDVVIKQLEVISPSIVIQRVTGDGVAEDLIAPQWTLKKRVVINAIDQEMSRRDTWQGKYFLAKSE